MFLKPTCLNAIEAGTVHTRAGGWRRSKLAIPVVAVCRSAWAHRQGAARFVSRSRRHHPGVNQLIAEGDVDSGGHRMFVPFSDGTEIRRDLTP